MTNSLLWLSYYSHLFPTALLRKKRWNRSRTYRLGLLLASPPAPYDYGNMPIMPAFLSDFLLSSLSIFRTAGYQLLLEPVDLASRALVREIKRQFEQIQMDGILLMPPVGDYLTALNTLDDLHIPYARVAPGIEPERSFAISIDEHGAA